jgi:hypothetical protein
MAYSYLSNPNDGRYSTIPSHNDPATKTSVEHLGQGQLEVPVQRTSSITVPPCAILALRQC